MRIRLETTDRDPIWLVGDPARNVREDQSVVMRPSLKISRNVQRVAGAGYDSQLQFDRGNRAVTLDADVRWVFPTEIARMDFIASLAPMDLEEELHRWSGNAYLRIDIPGGSGFKEWLMPDVVVTLAGIEMQDAVGLKLTYSIMASGFGDASSTAINLTQLYARIGQDPATLTIGEAMGVGGNTLDEELALYAASWAGGPAYPGGEISTFEIAITGSPSSALKYMAWDLADYDTPGGLALPLSDHFEDMADAFETAHGPGLLTFLDSPPRLVLTSALGDDAALVYWAVLSRDGSVLYAGQVSATPTYLDPITVDGGLPLVVDLG